MNTKFVLQVIPRPNNGEYAVLIPENFHGEPVMIGEGNDEFFLCDYLCGGCNTLLIKNAWPGQIQNVVLQCTNSKCKSYNIVSG